MNKIAYALARTRLFHTISIIFDVVSVVYFFSSTLVFNQSIIPLEIIIGVYFAVEYVILLFSAKSKWGYIKNPLSVSNILIIVGYLVPPVSDLGFLRILRALRVIHLYQLIPDMKMLSPRVVKWEGILTRIAHILVLVVLVSELIYILQAPENKNINTPFDSFYFTISSIAKVGFDEDYLIGVEGKILSILVTIISLTLFFQLVEGLRKRGREQHVCPVCNETKHHEHHKDVCHFCDAKGRDLVS